MRLFAALLMLVVLFTPAGKSFTKESTEYVDQELPYVYWSCTQISDPKKCYTLATFRQATHCDEFEKAHEDGFEAAGFCALK